MKSLPVWLHILSVYSVVQPEDGPARAETRSYSLVFNVQVLCLTDMYSCPDTLNVAVECCQLQADMCVSWRRKLYVCVCVGGG